jgi:hypothetical protein
MRDNDEVSSGWRSRIAAWRGNRRRAGALGAAFLAALAVSDAASGRRRDRPDRGARRQGDGSRWRCGGVAGTSCPKGLICIDDPRDACDPAAGGADCGGVCVGKRRNPCARMRCAEGTACCPRCGGLCIPRDVSCTGSLCNPTPCNEVVCGPGEFCCNESCGECAPLGGACTDRFCPPEASEPCGQTVCAVGTYCCAAHCSLCLPVGETCLDVLCPHLANDLLCGPVVCAAGEVCCNARCGICAPPDACTAQVQVYGCADGLMRG